MPRLRYARHTPPGIVYYPSVRDGNPANQMSSKKIYYGKQHRALDSHEARMSARIEYALKHIDCPLVLLDDEALGLARHISRRLCRLNPK